MLLEQLLCVLNRVSLSVGFSDLHNQHKLYAITDFDKILHRESDPVAFVHRVRELQFECVLFEQLYRIPDGVSLAV